MQKITITLSTDADPSTILDAAIRVAGELAGELECEFDENEVSVESLDEAHAAAKDLVVALADLGRVRNDCSHTYYQYHDGEDDDMRLICCTCEHIFPVQDIRP